MIFKDAQAAMPIYIFDRNELTLTQAKVTSVVPSHYDPKMMGKMVVDITTDSNQKYAVEDSLAVAYFGSSAISLDRDSILREIEQAKASAEHTLESVPRLKEAVEKCNRLLVENNPALKEKQENEARFSGIESNLNELKDMFADFIKKMS